jgi:hypothetical protein
MRSLISTLASTAAPIVSTKPAMPACQRRIEHRHDAQDQQRVDQQRDRRINTEAAIVTTIQPMTASVAAIEAMTLSRSTPCLARR